jgi:hypothetical protein
LLDDFKSYFSYFQILDHQTTGNKPKPIPLVTKNSDEYSEFRISPTPTTIGLI